MTSIEQLIKRARNHLYYRSEKETAQYFHDEGVDDTLAYLAIKAAKILIKNGEYNE